ncbi:MAG: hypothetical protein ACI4TK_09260 [Agathobacter sp.]
MKKKLTLSLSLLLVFAIIGVLIFLTYRSSESYRKEKAAGNIAQWDCSVSCAESSDEYVITYSDVKVTSQTGVLTIQNRNDFDIVVHLLSAGEQEIVSDNIPAGGSYSFLEATDKEYTVGVHADVDENTEMKVFVYDGKSTEPYAK